MAAIHPNSRPLRPYDPNRNTYNHNLATLSIIRRYLDTDVDEDISDVDIEVKEESDEEEATEMIGTLNEHCNKGAHKSVNKASKGSSPRADKSDDEDAAEEEFVLCTLDPAKVCSAHPLYRHGRC
jgi:hypothetical protein